MAFEASEIREVRNALGGLVGRDPFDRDGGSGLGPSVAGYVLVFTNFVTQSLEKLVAAALAGRLSVPTGSPPPWLRFGWSGVVWLATIVVLCRRNRDQAPHRALRPRADESALSHGRLADLLPSGEATWRGGAMMKSAE